MVLGVPFMPNELEMTDAPLTCDLLVLGSGAGGMSAAVTAAHLGLRVIVAEKEPLVGGTTAWSGGWMWVPRNPLARAAGIDEPFEAALNYLRHELGARFDEVRVKSYLNHAPQMVEFFDRHTQLKFIDGNLIPDFHGHSPYAATGGRSVCAAAFDARALGADAVLLKPPLWENTLHGLGISAGAELRHFINATRSFKSLRYVVRRLGRYAWDLLRHGRSQRLVNGHALAGALLASARQKGVEIRLKSAAIELLSEDGRVTGAILQEGGQRVRVQARCGVVLATGGFPHDAQRKQQLLNHVQSGDDHKSAASWGNTGDGLRLGESVGGQVRTDLLQAAALAPVSVLTRADGKKVHFPHLIDRAKPGLIAVTAAGRRFVNEADSYHDFMQALMKVTPPGQLARAWLIADHDFVRRFGLGAVKPAPMPMGAHLRSGYLKRAHSLSQLATRCGLDPEVLMQTVRQYNQMAQQGVDTEFGKGQTSYNRIQGDSTGQPNACMAQIHRGPFYAVEVVQGSLGTFAGLRVNAQGQVLNAQEQPLPGLYASGNDMSSMMGGNYPSGGITLGPAMTFGFVLAQHAAGQSLGQGG
jgi:succinate dehydrogenase/fumarate reductase flavoprotein subunit